MSFDAFVAPFSLALCNCLKKLPHFACGGGAMNPPISIGIVRMCPAKGRLQCWVGKVRSDRAAVTVTLMLYGEAALSVVCTLFP
jgi:hypothetical protein